MHEQNRTGKVATFSLFSTCKGSMLDQDRNESDGNNKNQGAAEAFWGQERIVSSVLETPSLLCERLFFQRVLTETRAPQPELSPTTPTALIRARDSKSVF